MRGLHDFAPLTPNQPDDDYELNLDELIENPTTDHGIPHREYVAGFEPTDTSTDPPEGFREDAEGYQETPAA